MARGKHAKSAAHRRAADAEETFIELARRFVDELDRTLAAEAAAGAVDAERHRLEQLTTRRDGATSSEVRRVHEVLDELEEAVRAEEDIAKRLRKAFSDSIPVLANLAFPGAPVDKMERFFDVINGGHAAGHLMWGAAGMDEQAGMRLQRAKGTRVATDREDDRENHYLYQSGLPGFVEVSNLSGAGDEGALPFPTVEAGSLSWKAAASPSDEAGLAQQRAVQETDIAFLAARGWVNPYVAAPLFPRPIDASMLHVWYAAAAQSLALTAEMTDGDDSPAAHLARDVAGLVAQAAPYWLPAGQAAGYAESQALSDEDRDELRMPHGRTIIVPSEPIVIGARPGLPPVVDHLSVSEWDMALRGVVFESTEWVTKGIANENAFLSSGKAVPLSAAVWSFGLRIEAIVVEADRAGKRTGRGVICFGVPTPDGLAMLGRVPVPVTFGDDLGELNHVVDQFCAAVAWGQWAEVGAGDDDEDDAAKRSRSAASQPAPLVRVLDVAATDGEGSGSSEPSGRHVAPHTRRGHWRRQHHGPGNALVKRVRIAPVLVNAKLGPLAPRVYRVRPTTATEDHALDAMA